MFIAPLKDELFEMEFKLPTYRVFLVFVLLYMSVLSTGIDIVRRDGANTTYAFVGSEAHTGTPNHATMIQKAHDAHTAMQDLPGGKKPSVMTALWTGNGRIYFGSSMPGGALPVTWVDQHVTDAMQVCRTRTGGDHRCNGRCGEINALSHWYQSNTGALPQHGKLIVTVTKTKTIAPCNPLPTESGFGCKQLLEELGFNTTEIIIPVAAFEGTEPLQNVLDIKTALCYI